MNCRIRKWELSDAENLAAILSNKIVRATYTGRPQSWDIILLKNIGVKAL